MERAKVLESVCNLISAERLDDAKTTLVADYPRTQASTPRGKWSPKRLVQVFIRDGFTDRYSGDRLVFPGTLRALLSIILPESFPYHPNWKGSATHSAFYELYPTIDHIVPVARGGADDENNVVTTSMLRNGAKGNWFVEELGWPGERAPVVPEWDGLLTWFLSTFATN